MKMKENYSDAFNELSAIYCIFSVFTSTNVLIYLTNN